MADLARHVQFNVNNYDIIVHDNQGNNDNKDNDNQNAQNNQAFQTKLDKLYSLTFWRVHKQHWHSKWSNRKSRILWAEKQGQHYSYLVHLED